MSTKYPGGFITKNYTAPTPSSAPGVWTLDQQEQAQKAGIWPFGGPFNYIEDVFSAYLYAGNSSTQTINNGIDLSTKGGLVWIKDRTAAANHGLVDTARGFNSYLSSDSTAAAYTNVSGYDVTAFNTNGFSLGPSQAVSTNTSGDNYVSWTFRKQPKFFDVVTWTGNGGTYQTISHSLGSVPGFIATKQTSTTGNWWCYHTSLGDSKGIRFNLTNTSTNVGTPIWAPTSTTFNADSNLGLNDSGVTYVAYIFAHNAGGFGPSATDNVISCGSYVGTGVNPGPIINLGFEPQWILVKNITTAFNWSIYDNMRGMPSSSVNTGSTKFLRPNTSDAEAGGGTISPTATGFQLNTTYQGANSSGDTFIYIAIRRGPMKVPTDATKVYNVVSQNGGANPSTITNSFASDMILSSQRSNAGGWGFNVADKLRGSSIASGSPYLTTPTTSAEGNFGAGYGFDLTNTNVQENFWYALGVNTPVVYNMFQRAPSFFDEVCYTGTGVGTSQTHNLGKIPELKIIKSRSGAVDWVVGGSIISGVGGRADSLILDSSAAISSNSTYWDSADTSTTFSVRAGNGMSDGSGSTYVAYLFATCPGVSKVGSYTGTGTLTTVNCGFTGGARFVLIKRTDTTGNWFVWDTARGMVSGTDPSLSLNTTSAESNANSVYTATTGFQLLASPSADVNTSGGTYIYLAIA